MIGLLFDALLNVLPAFVEPFAGPGGALGKLKELLELLLKMENKCKNEVRRLIGAIERYQRSRNKSNCLLVVQRYLQLMECKGVTVDKETKTQLFAMCDDI